MVVSMKTFYLFLGVLLLVVVSFSLFCSYQEQMNRKFKKSCRNCQHCCGIHDSSILCLLHSVQMKPDGCCADYQPTGTL